MSNMQNPFVRQVPAKPKSPSGLSQKDGEMITRVLAKEVHNIVKPLVKRIEDLETTLEFAQREAAKALENETAKFISRRGE